MARALVSTLSRMRIIPRRVRARSLINALVITSAIRQTPPPEKIARALNFRYLVHKLKRQGQNRHVDKILRAKALKIGLAKRGVPIEDYLAMRRLADQIES